MKSRTMTFSDDAKEYLLSRDWKINPKDSFFDHLTQLKTKLEENYDEAPKILAQMGAQMEDDSEILNQVSGEDISAFFTRYPARKLVFEIRHVFVDKFFEKKYVLVDNEKIETDMIAYVIFQYSLVEQEKGINKKATGSFKCYHRQGCPWNCEF